MDEQILQKFVNKIFDMVLPSGWLGRPWDDAYFILSVQKNTSGYSLGLTNIVQKVNSGFSPGLQNSTLEMGPNTQFFSIGENLFFLVDRALFTTHHIIRHFDSGVIVFMSGDSLERVRQIYDLYKRINEMTLNPW